MHAKENVIGKEKEGEEIIDTRMSWWQDHSSSQEIDDAVAAYAGVRKVWWPWLAKQFLQLQAHTTTIRKAISRPPILYGHKPEDLQIFSHCFCSSVSVSVSVSFMKNQTGEEKRIKLN
jgi:hypothetical protein